MGYNTVLFFCNDSMNEIKKHPEEFFNEILKGTSHCGTEPYEFGLGCSNGFAVVSCQHADLTTVIAAGGNYASILGTTWGSSHHEADSQVRILKELADKLGYRMTKKPKSKLGTFLHPEA